MTLPPKNSRFCSTEGAGAQPVVAAACGGGLGEPRSPPRLSGGSSRRWETPAGLLGPLRVG